MFPVEHFLVAAIPTGAYLLLQDRRLPRIEALFVIGVGSQFPDLIDKPLAHLFLLLPNGRVGAHSLPFAIPLMTLALYVAWKLNRWRAGGVFVFAYATHLVADYYIVLVRPDPTFPVGLLWPLVPPLPARLEPSWAGPGSVNVIIWSSFAVIVLLVGAVRLWIVYQAEYPD